MSDIMEVQECLDRYEALVLKHPVMRQVGKAYNLYAKIFEFSRDYSHQDKLRFFEELEMALEYLEATT